VQITGNPYSERLTDKANQTINLILQKILFKGYGM